MDDNTTPAATDAESVTTAAPAPVAVVERKTYSIVHPAHAWLTEIEAEAVAFEGIVKARIISRVYF